MINEQVMIDTITRLIEAGIDDPTIISTLVDAGLSQEEAVGLVQRVRASKTSQQSQAADAPVSTQQVQQLKTQVETQAEQHDLHMTQTAAMLDDHEDRLTDIATQIDEVKSSVLSPSSGGSDPAVSYRLGELESKLEEINAETKTLLDLLQKILETNRKILTELEAQK